MRTFLVEALGLAAWLLAGSTASAEVQLTMANGRVSLVAKDVTVRQILAEWAKVGQTKIINAERIPGGPVTLQLTNVPEQQALDVLLRSVSGYMAAPRASEVANASRFDRIIVMPTSTAPAVAARPATPAPVFQQGAQPPVVPQQTEDDQDDSSAPANRPTFNTFPQPQIVNPQQQGAQQGAGVAPAQGPLQLPSAGGPAAASGVPSVPSGGVAVPGMIVPPPQQPGQVQPAAPGQPPRRPGGGSQD